MAQPKNIYLSSVPRVLPPIDIKSMPKADRLYLKQKLDELRRIG